METVAVIVLNYKRQKNVKDIILPSLYLPLKMYKLLYGRNIYYLAIELLLKCKYKSISYIEK